MYKNDDIFTKEKLTAKCSENMLLKKYPEFETLYILGYIRMHRINKL